MALKPKTAVFQVRIDPETLVRFQVLCEMHHSTVSDYIRRIMLAHLERFDREQERKRQNLGQQQGRP